ALLLPRLLPPGRHEVGDGLGLERRNLLGLDDALEVIEGGLGRVPGPYRQPGQDTLFVIGPELLPGLLVVGLVGAGQQFGLTLLAELLGVLLAPAPRAAALAAALPLRVDPTDVPAGPLRPVLLHLLVVLVNPRATHRHAPRWDVPRHDMNAAGRRGIAPT